MIDKKLLILFVVFAVMFWISGWVGGFFTPLVPGDWDPLWVSAISWAIPVVIFFIVWTRYGRQAAKALGG